MFMYALSFSVSNLGFNDTILRAAVQMLGWTLAGIDIERSLLSRDLV